MQVGIVGINHKIASLRLREGLAKACQRRFGPVNSVQGEHHFILLSTCNRTEVYFSSEDLAVTHTHLLGILRNDVDEEFDQKLYSFFGKDCFQHLCRVASGLDSAIVAETEIQGQVKGAYEAASTYHQLPKELHYLFQKSIMVSKQVRTQLQLGRGMPNLEHAVYNCGRKFFLQPEAARILFVGTSDINKKILQYLKEKRFIDITVCNRSDEAAQLVASARGLKTLEWSCLGEWPHYDWLVVGTKASEYLISGQVGAVSPKLIIDLSVPRNVNPRVGECSNVTLLNIDQIIQTLAIRNEQMTHDLVQAEHIVAQAAQQHVSRFRERERFQVGVRGLALVGA